MLYTHTHTHTQMHNGILLSHKKEWNNTNGINMDGPRDTKWSKSVRGRQIYDITYMWNQKDMIHMNLFTKQR